jgi:hypothetical protein
MAIGLGASTHYATLISAPTWALGSSAEGDEEVVELDQDDVTKVNRL